MTAQPSNNPGEFGLIPVAERLPGEDEIGSVIVLWNVASDSGSACRWERDDIRCAQHQMRCGIYPWTHWLLLSGRMHGAFPPVIPDGFGFCPQCGVQQYDEDGSCVACGATATGAAVDQMRTAVDLVPRSELSTARAETAAKEAR